MRESNVWYRELITPHLVQDARVSRLVHSAKSKFQDIAVVDTLAFGRILVLDGKIQSSQLDEFIYHEALVHPPLISHPSPHSVFIAGGGEGATLREVLAHKTVERAVMVDIDRDVIDVARRYLQDWHQGSFKDPRTELRHEDAVQYLKDSSDTFDVIIIDVSDPVEGNPAAALYTREFFKLARGRLTGDGLLVIQAETVDYGRNQAFTATCNTLKAVFPRCYPYQVDVPSFSGNWGFVIGSLGPDPTKLSPETVDSAIAQRLSRPLKCYDGEAHRGLFSLPKHVRESLRAETRILTEKDLLVVP